MFHMPLFEVHNFPACGSKCKHLKNYRFVAIKIGLHEKLRKPPSLDKNITETKNIFAGCVVVHGLFRTTATRYTRLA